MKKLFVSVPMKGRTKENIKRSIECMHKTAETTFDEELELIDSYVEDNPPKDINESIWYLGKSIELLSQADYFIGVDDFRYAGCKIEYLVAREYGIKNLLLDTSRYECFKDITESNKYYSCVPQMGCNGD